MRSKNSCLASWVAGSSAGVVGLNTSALVESAIIGRPVFTLLAGDDGMLDLASSMAEHAAHVRAALADPS